MLIKLTNCFLILHNQHTYLIGMNTSICKNAIALKSFYPTILNTNPTNKKPVSQHQMRDSDTIHKTSIVLLQWLNLINLHGLEIHDYVPKYVRYSIINIYP